MSTLTATPVETLGAVILGQDFWNGRTGLEDAPAGTVIVDTDGDTFQSRGADDWGFLDGTQSIRTSGAFAFPVTVLSTPKSTSADEIPVSRGNELIVDNLVVANADELWNLGYTGWSCGNGAVLVDALGVAFARSLRGWTPFHSDVPVDLSDEPQRFPVRIVFPGL